VKVDVTNSIAEGQQLLITQHQGENAPVRITFVATNITGYTFKGTVNFPTPLQLSIGSGITIVDAVKGIIEIRLTNAQTQYIDAGKYSFDLWQITPDATPVKTLVIEGSFLVETSLTEAYP
jgi:hypothetical protein